MLDPLRRRQYLEAMGIQSWSLRTCRGAAVDPLHRSQAMAAQAQERDEAALRGSTSGSQQPMQPLGPIPGDAQGRGVSASAAGQGGTVSAAGESAVSGAPLEQLQWAQLETRVAGCRACDLHETRTQVVFGVGKRDADLLVIGEAPGADEDRKGEPFVGRAGQLLNAMLFAMGLRREQVFIANILKCRPPGNRDPRPEEVAHCEHFLMRQVELVQPKVILAVGRVSAQNLLRSPDTVGRLRSRVHAFGDRRIPLVVTYHPAYLLRSPDQKPKAWQDLQRVMELLHGGRLGD